MGRARKQPISPEKGGKQRPGAPPRDQALARCLARSGGMAAAEDGGRAPQRHMGAASRRRTSGGGHAGSAGGCDGPRRDARALARRRLLFLALVLVASTAASHTAAALSPAKTFAVASHSMEPLISRGDLVVAGPGTPEVGDVVVYLAATGEHQTHRVVQEVESDGKTLYVTRGDANDGEDSFLVSPSDVVGVVHRTVPLVGYLWLVPLAWKAGLFGALLLSYLGMTAWDATPRPAPAALVALVLLVPVAMAGVGVEYPGSAHTPGITASALPISAGSAGSATVAGDANSATATADAPAVWKEIPLHGAGSDVAVLDATWSIPSENRAVIDAAHYDPTPDFFLEAVMRADSSSQTVEVRLYDTTAGAAVAGTELSVSSSSYARVRTDAFSLADAHEYTFQAQTTAGTASIRQVKVISMQEAPVAATATHVRMSGADSTSSIFSSNVGAAAIWRYDGSHVDGTVSAYLEVVAQQSYSGSKVSNGRVHLRDLTSNSDTATIVLSDGPAQRYTVDASLVDGRQYTLRFRSPDAVFGGTTHLHHARLVVVQSGFEKTVSYVDLGGTATTSSATYEDAGYSGIRHGALEADGAGTHYFEATLNSASARLRDVDASAAVTEISTGSGRSRERSGALELPGADTEYRLQILTSSSSGNAYSAWIITHLDLSHPGLRHDHVLQSAVQTPTGTCTWRFSLSDVSGTSLDRMQRAEVDWRVGAAGTTQETPLPTGRQFTSAVWTGTYAFIFGGTDGTRTNQIVRYDPATDSVATMTAVLPSARAETSAIWDGSHAYVFGGHSGSGLLDQIVRYDPATDSVTTMAALPSGIRHASAVWDGSHAYIFGGITGSGNTDQILRYDPATDTVATLASVLPTPRYGTSAVWDGSHAYVLGGSNGGFFDDIVRFDPATETVTLLSATLPTARYYTSAVWAGTYAYVFGGYDTDSMDRIDRFDPQTGRVATMHDALPTARYGTAAVWDGAAAHVVGGLETGAADSGDIIRYNTPVQVLGLGPDQVLRESGVAVEVPPGGIFQSIMDTSPAAAGTTTITTSLQGRCVGWGIHTEQAVTYRFT